MGLEKRASKSYFIFVNLGFTLSKSDILLLAALNSMQQMEAEAKPEAKPPMGQRRVRVREKGKANRRGSERRKGGQRWEKT